ncbi:hypothetical protein F4604DRAFT_1936595 [Suillus subluteus]|nr:hypothetical protein F4604DRAFT_1936595 [Suillus subluteus]
MESNLRPRRKAKDQALDNPVWQPLKARSKQPHKCEPLTSSNVGPVLSQAESGKKRGTKTTAVRRTKTTTLPAKNKRDPKTRKRPLPLSLASDSEEEARQSKKACRPAIESEPDSDAGKQSDLDASEGEESEIEPAESVAKSLFGEVPMIAHSHPKKPHQRQLARVPPSPKATSSSRSSITPPPPIWGSQLKTSNARERKHAAEVPLWDPIMTSSSFGPWSPTARVQVNRTFSNESILVEDEAEDDHNPTLNISSDSHSTDESDAEPHDSTEPSLQVDPMARLVYTKTGSVRLTDQNIELRKVIQRSILGVKAHIAFEHGYPDLVTKNVYTREILLNAAQYHSAAPIQKRMQIDNEYLLALTNIIDARASLFRSEIKDVTSKSILGYFRLGGFNCDPILDRLLTNHSYIFPQTFDSMFLILHKVFFKHLKSIGMQFEQRFRDIAKNKSGRPEIPVPMLSIVCTAICATLLAKRNKSTDDFKFTGNQFLDIYNHHVSLLRSIQKKAPIKFHKMMADIYEEVHRFRHSITGDYDQGDDLSFLDLDGMEDE